jgi:type III secretion protein V
MHSAITRANQYFFKQGYSDIILAFGVVAIVALMILPLPLVVIDILVAINILIAVTLLLLAIYVPTPTAFSSFPSVILLTTLFRLSLSVATTRLILLDADAGQIIVTFGKMVAGGNMVVGIVVFVIITVVQFIVIAKGSERVAEVAARFTLDAMPGKQMSIDSDLRSGVIDKEEMLRRRHLLELESQMNGALDGAMKFVKGDAIAGIIIVIVNILGGLAIGIMQKNLSAAEAAHTYSLLTIGDGLVAQIPALLTSISAGLIITRSTSDDSSTHLGKMIASQMTNYPKAITICGVFALLFTLIPGFPWIVFLIIGTTLLSITSINKIPTTLRKKLSLPIQKEQPPIEKPDQSNSLTPPPAIVFTVERSMLALINQKQLMTTLEDTIKSVQQEYGVPIPSPQLNISSQIPALSYTLSAHGIDIGNGILKKNQYFHFKPYEIPTPQSPQASLTANDYLPALQGEWIEEPSPDATGQYLNADTLLTHHLHQTFTQNLGLFLGIQEASDLVTLWNNDYPDLIKEMLRVVTPQILTELLKRLLQESIPIRHLREIFEAITDAGSRERDVTLLFEHIRIALKQHISNRYAGSTRYLKALLVHPELEETLRQSIQQSGKNHQPTLDPNILQQIMVQLRNTKLELNDDWEKVVLICSMEIRRHIRKLTEDEFFSLPILSYQELAGDINIDPIGHLKISLNTP